MKKRPLLLKLMALTIFLVPLCALAMIYFTDRSLNVLNIPTVRFQFIIFLVGSFIAALGVFRVKPWGFSIFLVYVFGIIALDLVELIARPQGRNFWYIVDFSMIFVGLVIINQKKWRRLFFDKAMRWWERATRIGVDLDASLLVEDKPFQAKIVDISQTGCLAYFPEQTSLGVPVNLAFTVGERTFSLKGKVVRQGKPANTIGIVFDFPNFSSRLKLTSALKSHRYQMMKSA